MLFSIIFTKNLNFYRRLSVASEKSIKGSSQMQLKTTFPNRAVTLYFPEKILQLILLYKRKEQKTSERWVLIFMR